jgi:septum formation protein
MILLASQSPRRREMLATAGYRFRVRSADADETFPPGLSPGATAEHVAAVKAAALAGERAAAEWLVAADTIVAVDGTRLAKPADAAEATAMLERLSGRIHEVCTGVCLLGPDGAEARFHERTEVDVAPLRPGEIRHYVESCRPFDKAGAYAIQEWIGLTRITAIRGCYANVVGLPMPRLYAELLARGVDPLG